jgi:hypothetical protein
VKAIDFDGHIVLRATLNGDRIPICNVDNLEISLVSPDLPVRVKLPMDVDNSWRALPDIRAAELQCMQLSLSILSRHESEVYVSELSSRQLQSRTIHIEYSIIDRYGKETCR